MAPVLQCPECGARHPLDSIGIRSAFPCTGCGRTLKVPAQARALVPEVPSGVEPVSVAPSVAAPTPVAAPVPVPAPPVPVVADRDATRVYPTTPPPTAATAAPPVAPPEFDDDLEPLGVAPFPPDVAVPPGRAAAGAPPAATGAPLELIPGRWARFGMWIIAVPLAFLVVFGLAKALGILTTNQITDVALAEGWQRFVPIARLVPFVALATAGIVHGGAYGIARLRANRASGPSTPSAPGRPRATRPSGTPRTSRTSRTPRQPSGKTR